MTRPPSHAGPFCFARAVSGLPALLRIGSLCIGVGNGALGQAVCLPRCGLACPIAWFRAPVLLQVGSQCIGVGNGALGQALCLPRGGLACPIVWFRALVRLAGVRFHSDTSAFTVIPRSASVIPLAKWRYPFENVASLVKLPACHLDRAG